MQLTLMEDTVVTAKVDRMTRLPVAAQKRLESGGVILHWPEGGVASPAIAITANKPILRGGVSQCYGCKEVFRSVYGFDKHQLLDETGRVICWDPASIGMIKDANGRWITGLYDGPER